MMLVVAGGVLGARDGAPSFEVSSLPAVLYLSILHVFTSPVGRGSRDRSVGVRGGGSLAMGGRGTEKRNTLHDFVITKTVSLFATPTSDSRVGHRS